MKNLFLFYRKNVAAFLNCSYQKLIFIDNCIRSVVHCCIGPYSITFSNYSFLKRVLKVPTVLDSIKPLELDRQFLVNISKYADAGIQRYNPHLLHTLIVYWIYSAEYICRNLSRVIKQ